MIERIHEHGIMPLTLTRRSFITSVSAVVAGHLLGCNPDQEVGYTRVDAFIKDKLEFQSTPGIAVCVTRGEHIEWANAYGWADIAGRKPMTPDTIQNIASISKTITATAVMQLWESNKLGLDDDVNDYLPFPVRNPRFPDTPITIRQLLTHSSSITDGPAYEPSYACGDPTMSLMDWLQAYFDPSGANYDAMENFHSWEPGTKNLASFRGAYSNLAFGLLGGLVETATPLPFADHCRQNIFEPLSMMDTGWYLSTIDEKRHAVPYGTLPDPRFSTSERGASQGSDTDYHPHCLYSFTNYPDGLLRTSVSDLSKFLRAHIGHGAFGSVRILDEATIDKMFTESSPGQGLCWRKSRHLVDDETAWGHSGGDPGVSTVMYFSRNQSFGVIVFSNYDGWDMVREASQQLFIAASNAA